MKKELRKEVWFPRPQADIWVALTDPQALADWLMPNNFRPEVGHVFRFHVDPMPGFSGISECRVLEVTAPSRLVYTWLPLPKVPDATPPPPMTLTWTLMPEEEGTRVVLEQTGLDIMNWWWRFSMTTGWNRMLKKLLPRTLKEIRAGVFTTSPGRKRDYGTRTVPEGYAR
jgi:uncharacterized protein YndB with AHSA1/START domain